jgi:hypothetical protein
LQKITSQTNIFSGASVFLCTGMTTCPKFFLSSLFYVLSLFFRCFNNYHCGICAKTIDRNL